MKKKGFTLIELLAVIVILAVIALIATPLIMGTITKAKMNSLKDTAYGILKAAENQQTEKLMSNEGNIKPLIVKNLENDTTLLYKGKKPKCGYVVIASDIEKIVLSDGQYLVRKDDIDKEAKVSKGTCSDIEKEIAMIEKPIQDGLQVYFDGMIKPVVENGKLVWKDQSGNGRDGEMINFIGKDYYQNNSIVFDGTDYIRIGDMNYETVTLEAYVNSKESPKTESEQYHILSNTQFGGYCILNQRDQMLFTFYKKGIGYTYYEADYMNKMNFPIVDYGKDYYYGATYDKKMSKFYVNDKKYQYEVNSEIGKTTADSMMLVGANPAGKTEVEEYYHGTIYGIRVYNRALSEEEIRHNYIVDKLKYS